jgi:hypothetical protein
VTLPRRKSVVQWAAARFLNVQDLVDLFCEEESHKAYAYCGGMHVNPVYVQLQTSMVIFQQKRTDLVRAESPGQRVPP